MNDFSDYYRVTRMTFQAFGLWPYQKFQTRAIILILVLFDLVSITVPMVWYIIEVFANTTEMVNCLPPLFIFYVGYMTLFTSVVNMNKIRSIFHFIKISWENLSDTEEEEIFKRYARKGQLIATSILGMAITGLFVYGSLPLISKYLDSIFEPNVPHSLENIIKVNFYNLDPKEHYLLINSYCFQGGSFGVISAIMYGVYFPQIIHHACGMFAVLSHKIENINRINFDLHNKMSNAELDKVLSSEIKTCIRYHWECMRSNPNYYYIEMKYVFINYVFDFSFSGLILCYNQHSESRFSEMIENSTKYLWLMRFFVDSGMITVLGVQAVVNIKKPIYLISGILNTSGIIFFLFCITWASEQLLDHSDQLCELIYNIDWYEFPPRSKKLIHVMLLRSGRPCRLTAGGMIDLNLETFGRFMKLSASYFTLVLSTQ